MKTYTVLLLRPDYAANDFGTDTYQAHVMAKNVKEAQLAAQREAVAHDNACSSDAELAQYVLEDADDYAVLMVIEGHQADIKEVDD